MMLPILASLLLAQVTAQQIIDRIHKEVGIPWRAQTVDTFKAGDPNTPVSGVAVTMMATLDVLQRAAAAGDNLLTRGQSGNHLDPAVADEVERGDSLGDIETSWQPPLEKFTATREKFLLY